MALVWQPLWSWHLPFFVSFVPFVDSLPVF
jgi:hypothetical protein